MENISFQTIKKINPGCHRIPDRCFKVGDTTMPFCSRCLGSAIGHIISIALLLFGVLPNLFLSTLFLIIMITDWGLQYLNIIISTNTRRLITGVFGGLGVGSLIWNTFVYIYNTLL